MEKTFRIFRLILNSLQNLTTVITLDLIPPDPKDFKGLPKREKPKQYNPDNTKPLVVLSYVVVSGETEVTIGLATPVTLSGHTQDFFREY